MLSEQAKKKLIASSHCQLTYFIRHSDGDLSLPKLSDIFTHNSIKIRELVWTGWSMFYIFQNQFAPKPIPENKDGTGSNIFEVNFVDARQSLPELWRASPKGWASLVRGYREDASDANEYLSRQPGTWIAPETIVRETAEFVRHAFLTAQYFPTCTAVEFECAWRGLDQRVLKNFDGSASFSKEYKCSADSKTTTGSWSPDVLAAQWPEVVANLACPVLELFGFTRCGASYIQGMAPSFIKLPPHMD